MARRPNAGAQKPWNSSDAFRPAEDRYVPVHFPDSPEEIDLCIQCPLPASECHGKGNCYVYTADMTRRPRKSRKAGGRFNEELFHKAHRDGLTRKQMAEMFGVLPDTIRRWNRQYGYNRKKEE